MIIISNFYYIIDEIFHLNFRDCYVLMVERKALFVKFWLSSFSLFKEIPYNLSILPGIKEGISGASIVGYNIGINGCISKKKIEASIKALKYLSSKKIQKKYFFIANFLPGIPSIFNDNEICKVVDCEIYKKIQPLTRPSPKSYSISEYTNLFNNYIHQFLYGNKTATEVLELADDLTRIYDISFSKNDSKSYALFLVII
eukprot:jgi/Orpsp1_1/1175700/evm.model.c7180000054885.1